jgi:hypothetical protein
MSKHIEAVLAIEEPEVEPFQAIDIDAILDATPVGQVESTLERLLSEQDAMIAAHAARITASYRDRGWD